MLKAALTIRASATWASRASESLRQLLPDEVSILGLDEHTACIMDLEANEATIKGIGSMTLRRGTAELTFEKGERFSLDVLRGKDAGKAWHEQPAEQSSKKSIPDNSRTHSGKKCMRLKTVSMQALNSTT